MAGPSSIEWTEASWNPVTGCDKISPGCKHCYAERLAKRLQAMGSPRYRNGFGITLHPDLINVPLTWRRPRQIFVNSMSDLFHEDIPIGFLVQVFSMMQQAHWHTFQVLTKRSGRLAELAGILPWPTNIWMGVSVETPKYFSRIRDLLLVPAAVRFLSLEPLLAPLPNVPLAGIDWVIVGGESGPGAREMKSEWVREIKASCEREEVAFFFKQWGGVRKKATGRILDGRQYDGMPQPTRRQSQELMTTLGSRIPLAI